jgi:hypothetical protein
VRNLRARAAFFCGERDIAAPNCQIDFENSSVPTAYGVAKGVLSAALVGRALLACGSDPESPGNRALESGVHTRDARAAEPHTRDGVADDAYAPLDAGEPEAGGNGVSGGAAVVMTSEWPSASTVMERRRTRTITLLVRR